MYLPENLYREVKEQRLPASELLQGAVVTELKRRELEMALDEYLSDLLDEVGQPPPEVQAWAEAVARSVRDHEMGLDN